MKAAGFGLDRRALAAIAKNSFAASFAGGESVRKWSDEVDEYVRRSALAARG